jgi:hypothetical protein
MINFVLLLLLSDHIELHDQSGLLHYKSNMDKVELKHLNKGMYNLTLTKENQVVFESKIKI